MAEQILVQNGVVGVFSASENGVLAYLTAISSAGSNSLSWFDRTGKLVGEVGPRGPYNDVTFSGDRKTFVLDRRDPLSGFHTVTVDLERGVFSRLNPDFTEDYAPAVSPDRRVAFTSGNDIYLRSVTGAGNAELLWKSSNTKHANSWSPDGHYLIYDEHHPTQQQDLWVLPVSGDRKPVPFLITPADETFAQFSPDGKYVAYSSNESGRREVYVRDFAPDRVPAIGAVKSQISIAGGDKPRWSMDGKEIYYIALDRKMTAVPVKTMPTFQAGAAVPLFETNASGFSPYDVASDGRFLINTVADLSNSSSSLVTVVVNWQSGLSAHEKR